VDGNVYPIASKIAPERLLLMRQGLYIKATDASSISKLRGSDAGFLGDTTGTGRDTLESPGVRKVSIEGQVDQTGLSALVVQNSNIHKNIYTPDKPYTKFPATDLTSIEEAQKAFKKVNRTAEQIQLSNLFVEDNPFSLSSVHQKYNWIARTNESKGFTSSPASWPNDVSVKFPGEDSEGLTSVTDFALNNDDEMYMPFHFQDLRDPIPKFLYFRAFLKEGLTETFSPEWQTERYYGRVDPVATYVGTGRNIQVAFDVVAWSPEDLPVMWVKLHKLQSMVYPSYDENSYLHKGPLIRMRIGDLFCASRDSGLKRGLPGFINSLDFAYDDGIWNIKTDYKIPRKVSVTLGFTVIHDGNPGIYPFDQKDLGQGESVPPRMNRTFGAMKTITDQFGFASQVVKAGDIRGVLENAEPPTLTDGIDGLI
jgi:hypothetical protein